jgi:uncharacterized protein (TIGR00159 family)
VIHLLKFFKVGFKRNKYKTLGSSTKIRLIRQLNDALSELSSTKTGALITIENKLPLDGLRTDGIILDANISSSLLLSIFNKKSPLHDGAVIIREAKIKYVATYFTITQSSIANKYGARHRAAIGISERSDSTSIVVSEETGKITLLKHGKMREIKNNEIQDVLTKFLIEH